MTDCESKEEIDEETKNILAKMDEINRHLETDSRSVKSLKTHSRQASISSQLSAATTETETSWKQWAEVLNNWESYSKKKIYLKTLVRQGIPNEFRPLVWVHISGVKESTQKIDYASLLKQPSAYEKHIRRDIARTYPQHEMFREKGGIGQESLFNVMKAYSLFDREVGYCQGSGFIVGLLLMLLPEEDAFFVLVQLMQSYKLRELFKPKMYELGLCLFQFESLLHECVPGPLADHMRAQGFHSSLYASSWFLTLFTTTFSQDIAFRIMDLVLSEGTEMIFKIALAYLQIVGDDLLHLDMEAMLCYMQQNAPQKIEEDPILLFNQAATVRINSKLMKKLEKEYSLMKSNELEVEIELRRLRTENGILLQRIDRLEAETANLTEKLVEEQMQRASEDAQTGELKRQLSLLRQKCRRSLVCDENDDSALPSSTATTITIDFNNDDFQSTSSPSLSGGLPSSGYNKSYNDNFVNDGNLPEVDLVALKNQLASLTRMCQEYQQKCMKLEEENSLLSRNPPNEVATLQEELIAAKLREAESNLHMNEMKKRLNDLEKTYGSSGSSSADQNPPPPTMKSSTSLLGSALKGLTNNNSALVSQLNEEISRLKLRNTSLHAELAELKQTTMELETQNQLSSRQLRRQDEEIQKIRDQLEAALGREKMLISELRAAQHLITDIETQRKEDLHNFRLRETEMSSKFAEDRLITGSGVNSCNSNSSTDSNTGGTGSRMDEDNNTSPLSQDRAFDLNDIWKNLPAHMMTESIGPLEELCFLPNDPMITSIYLDEATTTNTGSPPPSSSTSDTDDVPDRSDGASTPVVVEEL